LYDTINKIKYGGIVMSWPSLIIIGVMFVALYFFMIRPQKKQEKEIANMRNNLQVGDEVTTIGGVIGKIVSIKEETVMIETGHDRTKIRFLRSAIRSVDVHAEDAQD
jgi:preprotein translocase subunit YajC